MITIITEPSTDKFYQIKKYIKNIIKKYVLKRPIPKYSGHYAVVRSLLEGFDRTHQTYNYNPNRQSSLYDHVHVLANVNALRMAIKLKRRGKIKRLTAGPNIVISSADQNGLIASPEIDMYFVNSEWIKSTYLLDNPKLNNKVGIWPAGVNEADWKTEKEITKKPVALFYKKRPEHHSYEACKRIALDKGFDVKEIFYGSYTLNEFKEALRFAKCVVYFVEQESQGIALQEIWATNTPTFVWNPGIWMYKGINYHCCSSPYLTSKTGQFFRDITEFGELIEKPIIGYEPRKWIVDNMTDELCAKDFLNKTPFNNEIKG